MPDTVHTIGHNSAAVGEMLREEPGALFDDPKLLEQLVSEITEEIGEYEYDLSSAAGRKGVASLAYGIAQLKTKIDTAGKDLNDEHRAAMETVNSVRRDVRDQLDDLKTKARKPLDDWEDHKKAAEAAVRTSYERITELGNLPHGASSAAIQLRIDQVRNLVIDTDLVGEGDFASIDAEREATLQRLQDTYDRELSAEKDRAELAKLKAEQVERERAEAEAAEKLAAERAEQERQEKAEADRKAAEERAASEAADKARREAEEEAQAKLAESERQREAAEAELQRQRDEEAREKAESEKRERNKAHRSRIMKAAKTAIMKHGDVDEDAAKKIVLAIGAGSVPNITLNF